MVRFFPLCRDEWKECLGSRLDVEADSGRNEWLRLSDMPSRKLMILSG